MAISLGNFPFLCGPGGDGEVPSGKGFILAPSSQLFSRAPPVSFSPGRALRPSWCTRHLGSSLSCAVWTLGG